MEQPPSAEWCAEWRDNFLESITDEELDEILDLFEHAVAQGKMDDYGHQIGPDSEECVAVRAASARAQRRLQAARGGS